MLRKIVGLVVLGSLMVAAFLGHRINSRRGVSATLSSAPVELEPIALENLAVTVPPRFARLTPTLAEELDRGEGGRGYSDDLAASPLVLFARELPPGGRGWHGRISLRQLAVDVAPEDVELASCVSWSQDATHPLTTAEVRAEAIGPVCRSEHTSPNEAHALLVSAVFALPGADWVMVCHVDDRSPEDLAACDEVIHSVRFRG